MIRRWIVWTAGIGLIAVTAMLPLRLALDWSDLDRMGVTARQVAGTIWYGRIGEMHVRSQPLGTMEVALDPASLLIGQLSMTFKRMDSTEGPLEGRLVAGFSRGLVDTTGRIAVGSMFEPIPIAALELQNVTAVFRGGRCLRAGGRVSPVMASAIPGASFGQGLSGPVECDGERARVEIESSSGSERVDFYVQATGDYRAWISVRNPRPDVIGLLSALGFRSSPQGMTLSIDGRL